MKQTTLILLIATLISCQKVEIEAIPNTEKVSRGYVDYNGYIQDLPCIPIYETAYNSYDVKANRLTIHNDSVHIEIDSCYDITTDISRASGKFKTTKGGGRFLFVPKK